MFGDRLHDPFTKEKKTYNAATREHANAKLLFQLCNQIRSYQGTIVREVVISGTEGR